MYKRKIHEYIKKEVEEPRHYTTEPENVCILLFVLQNSKALTEKEENNKDIIDIHFHTHRHRHTHTNTHTHTQKNTHMHTHTHIPSKTF